MTGATFVTCPACGRLLIGTPYQPHDCKNGDDHD